MAGYDEDEPGLYEAERVDEIREAIERIEAGVEPRYFCGHDVLADWQKQLKAAEEYLSRRG